MGGNPSNPAESQSKFLQESAMIYKQAFDAARAEMKAAKDSTPSAPSNKTTVDFRA